jgi:hypothetical protein
VNTLETAGTRGVALRRSTPDFRQITVELHSETREEQSTMERAGHPSEIVLLLNGFERVLREGAGASAVLATGEDGYWAQYATGAANAGAVKGRLPLHGNP